MHTHSGESFECASMDTTRAEISHNAMQRRLVAARAPSAAQSNKMEGACAGAEESCSITLQFKWTDEKTEQLIRWRAANNSLFSGKRNAAVKGFETFLKETALQGVLTPAWVKKKWENLKQKYKELKCPPTGVSTEGGEDTAASWKWFRAMDEALGDRPSITPPILIASANTDAAVSSPPSTTDSREEVETPVRRRRRIDLLQYFRELEEKRDEQEMEVQKREERMTRELAEREERREKEAVEREEARERRRLEREEKREQERLDKEERREREQIEREERREKERMEREDRRDKETKEREERIIKIMEIIAKK
ncbi:nucleolar protein 58 isoform X2 [Cololabis saira]|uniref:nucleolar protein 58 isoform X2 n=1 Tax=Cololabis saira TaxID=129043 RepID=UPI002AD3133B|nr:nucleolar protein 58 isoform X2 [Cololabis saira]